MLINIRWSIFENYGKTFYYSTDLFDRNTSNLTFAKKYLKPRNRCTLDISILRLLNSETRSSGSG